ncbi:hypothetical protein BUALT_Bualt01G0142600 [Buddleja alternifolia]|uniref:Uncharacterized protein n=1 Tax=Buddleja alternifolia TaxID=168488 RepID=A0AAV6Y754_9LAMI|nr:hypothetical protein BUALT_Bualt01G0142600 [Buddleja alternifolia]
MDKFNMGGYEGMTFKATTSTANQGQGKKTTTCVRQQYVRKEKVSQDGVTAESAPSKSPTNGRQPTPLGTRFDILKDLNENMDYEEDMDIQSLTKENASRARRRLISKHTREQETSLVDIDLVPPIPHGTTYQITNNQINLIFETGQHSNSQDLNEEDDPNDEDWEANSDEESEEDTSQGDSDTDQEIDIRFLIELSLSLGFPSFLPSQLALKPPPQNKYSIMGIISEEAEEEASIPKPQLLRKRASSTSTPTTTSRTATSVVVVTGNPFQFWFYFTLIVSLVTLLFSIFLSSSSTDSDPKTWFLNLPPNLRHHYSNGRTIKVQTAPNHPQLELFSIQQGPTNSHTHVLIIHGLGCSSFSFQNVLNFLATKNVHAVAIDLPGSGFSDKSILVVEEQDNNIIIGTSGGNSFLGRVWQVYQDIKEKGLFWGFDQLVEQGYVDFDDDNSSNNNKVSVSKREESIKAIELGSEEMGRVLGQVVDSMGLAPVDLVLHDSAFGLSANWISENRRLIRSVVVLDSGTALPLWVLEMPVVREVVLGFRFVFERVIAMCCMKSVGGEEAEAHRILLKGRDGGRAVVGMGKKLNSSFDLSEWSSLDGVKGLPIQLIWSNGWSDNWTTKGIQISEIIPQAKLVTHSGGRWTQDHNAEEVGASIYEFVSSLPKVAKQIVEEPIPKHSQDNEEAKSSAHHHNGHGGYMDAYGLGQGLGM